MRFIGTVGQFRGAAPKSLTGAGIPLKQFRFSSHENDVLVSYNVKPESIPTFWLKSYLHFTFYQNMKSKLRVNRKFEEISNEIMGKTIFVQF